MESTGIYGKDGGFNRFLTKLGISNAGEYWNEDHSSVDWNKAKKHYRFFFDDIDNEMEITDWLNKSDLSKSEFLFTWLDYNDPIIKIRTCDFINSWEEFYIASVEGTIFTTIDGKFYLEFTDDWNFHLNSNFEIKPNTKQS